MLPEVRQKCYIRGEKHMKEERISERAPYDLYRKMPLKQADPGDESIIYPVSSVCIEIPASGAPVHLVYRHPQAVQRYQG